MRSTNHTIFIKKHKTIIFTKNMDFFHSQQTVEKIELFFVWKFLWTHDFLNEKTMNMNFVDLLICWKSIKSHKEVIKYVINNIIKHQKDHYTHKNGISKNQQKLVFISFKESKKTIINQTTLWLSSWLSKIAPSSKWKGKQASQSSVVIAKPTETTSQPKAVRSCMCLQAV